MIRFFELLSNFQSPYVSFTYCQLYCLFKGENLQQKTKITNTEIQIRLIVNHEVDIDLLHEKNIHVP
jgi:hypothetical protein